MTYLEQLQEKKQKAATEQAEAAKTKSIVDAVKSSGGDTKDSVTSAMHDLLLATLVAKDPRLAEVSDNLGKLLTSVATASKDLKQSGLDSIPRTFEQLIKSIHDLPDKVAATDRSGELIPYLKSIEQAISSSTPIFDPKVEATVDLTPVSKVLRDHLNRPVEKAVTLDGYKAQDLSTEGSTQYVGFVNPDGVWYIIENDMEGNSLRYVFGKSDYKKAWDNHTGKVYKLLNEAINAIRS